MPFFFSRYIYWRTEWINWVSSWNVVWSDPCSIRIDQQGNGCNGEIISWIIISLVALWSISITLMLMFKIFTSLIMQLEKYKTYDFGRCPRVYCCGQPCLPVGQSDIPRSSTVKIYCPKCEDIYYPRSKYQGSILMSAQRLLMWCIENLNN